MQDYSVIEWQSGLLMEFHWGTRTAQILLRKLRAVEIEIAPSINFHLNF